MKDKNLNIRVPEDLRDEFQRVTQAQSVNPSELIRRWIENYIEEADELDKRYYGATCPFCYHMNNVKLEPEKLQPEAELSTQCGVCKIVFPFTVEDLKK